VIGRNQIVNICDPTRKTLSGGDANTMMATSQIKRPINTAFPWIMKKLVIFARAIMCLLWLCAVVGRSKGWNLTRSDQDQGPEYVLVWLYRSLF